MFDAVEPVLVAHSGRPHWGKRHSSARDVFSRYRKLTEFLRVREQVDTGKKLVNPYLLELFSSQTSHSKAAHV